MPPTLLTVLLTAYNESATLEGAVDDLLREMEKLAVRYTILVANDGSSDWSEDLEKRLLSRKNVVVKSFYPNEGKGATLNKVFPMLQSEYVILTDADREYHASDIPALLKILAEDRADIVLGSRYGFGRKRPTQYLATYLVNRAINRWLWLLSGKRFQDVLCGLYGMKVSLLKNISLKEKRFSYTGEFFWRIYRQKVRWAEVPVSYTFRTYQSGKKIKWWETFTLLYALAKYKFSS